MRFRASDVATATGGSVIGADVELDGVSFDSRSVARGELFVALVAERDGHDFIPSARAAGAASILAGRDIDGGPAIIVEDTAQALMDLGRWARDRVTGHVVGITGSVGKTSTKDLTRAALAAGLRTAANERSFNNEQGLPVTILNAPDDTEALVLEMGMRGLGEIARLCEVGRPTIGVVTKVAAAHTARVGGIDGVTAAKSELVRALPAAGVAVLNADDDRVMSMAAVASCDVLTFGTGPTADVRVTDLSLDSLARPRFTLLSPWGAARVELAVSGAHMATNAAAALAVAGTCGVDLGAAASALREASLSPWRMELARTASGATLINDAYNANPASMRAAIETLLALDVAGRRIAVLGVMAELGDPVEDHAAIGRLLAEHDITLIACGTELYGVDPS
ncbi:MAG TPA: UDP-N-acetylmuramoyl-tripeptide--D-alanyl-D-alanine ligase, partial [Ilumatobacteraceae bacterium]